MRIVFVSRWEIVVGMRSCPAIFNAEPGLSDILVDTAPPEMSTDLRRIRRAEKISVFFEPFREPDYPIWVLVRYEKIAHEPTKLVTR